MRHLSHGGFLLLLFLLSCLMTGDVIAADEYVIGPEDVLKVSFWQDPQLDQIVTVRQDGKITLSIIGEIIAAGLTTRQLAEKIESNISLYNKNISQATVTVASFNSQKIFLSGQVTNPGKRAYEVIPDLWTVIKEGGGITQEGDLTRVTVIRSKESGGEVITVNVLEAIASGKLESLPKLKSGDTIEIPRMAEGLPGPQLAGDYATTRKNLYYVLGQVRTPGVSPYEKEIDLFDAIGAAGGATDQADLTNVRIVSKNGAGSTVTKVNLKKYQTNGQARRIVIKPEDTIIMGEKKHTLFTWSQIRDVAAVAGTVISFVYLIDRR